MPWCFFLFIIQPAAWWQANWGGNHRIALAANGSRIVSGMRFGRFKLLCRSVLAAVMALNLPLPAVTPTYGDGYTPNVTADKVLRGMPIYPSRNTVEKEENEVETVETRVKPLASTKPKPIFVASSLDDWLQPEAMSYQGLLFPRSPYWPCYQKEIDSILGELGQERTIYRGERFTELDFQQAAEDLLRDINLPQELRDLVISDAGRLGCIVASLCPWSKKFMVRVQHLGENSCTKWHRDYLCGRGFITYNLCGTQYVAEEHANLKELENCGHNDCVIEDQSKIQEVGVGDMLFMKGEGFPCGEKGFIHKSPPVQYSSGVALNRLVLKVDVPW